MKYKTTNATAYTRYLVYLLLAKTEKNALSTLNRILRIVMSETYFNHASRDLNMLKPETSRFHGVL